MTSRQLVVLTSLAMLAAACLHARDAAPEALQGCWRVERSILHYQDGTTAESYPRCVTRYGEHDFATACVDPKGMQPDARMEGRFEQIGDGTYVATLTRNSRLPEQQGKRSTVHFHVNRDRLSTTVYPPRLPGVRQVVSIDSTAVRVSGEGAWPVCPELPPR